MSTRKPLSSRSVVMVILIIAPQIFSFAFALDIYVPSIPIIKEYFNASQISVQLTVSLFLLMTGLGQLFMGPLSDQIGRRKIVLTSIIIFIIGSIICTVANNIEVLIIGRIVQAFGACGMMVSAFAMVRDLFDGDDCAKIYSFLNSTIALSPLVAPVIGGYLEVWINWRASFAVLAILSCLILASALLNINETLPSERRNKISRGLLKQYVTVLKSRTFLIYTFCAAAGFAGFLTFFSSSSYIIISLLKIPVDHFGFYFAAIGIVFFIGSFISGYCAKRFRTYTTVAIGAVLMAISGLVMLYWYYSFGLTIWGFMGPMMIMGIGGAMLMGGGAGGAIEPFGEMAGTASAVFGSFEFVFAFIVSTVVLEWKVESTIPLAITLLVFGLIAVILCLFNQKVMRR
ncbi:MAG: Bcr/CflA family efflux MFS transporter [Gammaproteobacteria bacterium]|nr:MAG: Bcr/CflA family efflux MFS transporter [Gammaproteobacteria bacterium]UTW41421.1 multidrug effflux MFS transporter [bacterium SCSIO 12844]